MEHEWLCVQPKYSRFGKPIEIVYDEDILIGYRWFDQKEILPLFPFGFGLSYSTFAIEKSEINVVSNRIENPGNTRISKNS